MRVPSRLMFPLMRQLPMAELAADRSRSPQHHRKSSTNSLPERPRRAAFATASTATEPIEYFRYTDRQNVEALAVKTRTLEKDGFQEPSGQRAALFPALSEGSKEKRAVSILLACMEQVPELAKALLQGQGAPLGTRSRLKAWTEAGPVGKKGTDRPDGRIEVESSRGQKWVALLEAKIGKAALESLQIEAYLAEGRTAGVSALITISNDFAVLANHHPTYRGKIGKGITLLHWSWSSILTKCRLLTDGGEIEDHDHRWVIEHLVRFLDHPSTGVTRFDRMPASWKEVTEAVTAGAGVKKGSEAALEVAAGWIQETRDLGLQLTDLLHQPVSVKLGRAEREDPMVFMNRVLDGLCNEQALEMEYLIPDGVSALKVHADLRSKALTSSMTIGAAEDRKTAKARVNWLLRQLAKTQEDGIHVKAVYGRREDIQAALARVRENPGILGKEDPKICPRRFEVKLIGDLGRKIEGPKTFVQALEKHVPEFYTQVGQYLRPWVPSAPRVASQHEDREKNDHGGTEAAAPESGGAGTEDAGAHEHKPHPGGTGDNPAGSVARDDGSVAPSDYMD